ncbi:MAG: hypothetical protein CVV33_01800 [Methanomicrobiales archaeon HGW-Methanomicrobiales-4]|nr:MAG: hypothetical protein CVV33_01800 [Methanomicrobiales archaeon HGW-Methanomicrobiales-4]
MVFVSCLSPIADVQYLFPELFVSENNHLVSVYILVRQKGFLPSLSFFGEGTGTYIWTMTYA